ncbi:MAG: hypothetical protein QOD99_1332 [Chthoniobacter sp.]|jgi:hypothetical protein|nr:hypothetical protein [Chthoniobacter sp.]
MSQAKLKIVAVALATAVTAGGYSLLPRPAEPAPAVAQAPVKTAAAKTEAIPAPELSLALADATQQGRVRTEFVADGKSTLVLTAHNTGTQPLRLHVAAGQLFASAKATVALARTTDIQIDPSARKTVQLTTVATSSSSAQRNEAFAVSAGRLPKLDVLFAYLDEHPEIPVSAVQTATLALTENLPVSAFAKFTLPSGGAGLQSEGRDFKADTSDIVTALLVLREIGMDRQLALTIDPQLKIEAMIDPLAHALALRYYTIADEWSFWKSELLTGNPATRHYALYGIARFYPEIAVQMLPKWARNEATNAVFRTSAIQALAETQRPEALAALRQLETELGIATDLGKTAHTAANFLDAQFTKSPSKSAPIAFRSSSKNLDGTNSAIAITN